MNAVSDSSKRARAVSAAELRERVERFLAACQDPILIEPGEAPFALSSSAHRLTERPDGLLLEAWDDARTLARRAVAVHTECKGRMELMVARFGGRTGLLTLADRAAARSAQTLMRGSREQLRELLRVWLARQYPLWKIEDLSTGADLEHTLSPAYARALITHAGRRCAALAAPAASADAALTFGLIWLDYLRRRDHAPLETLSLFLPAGTETNTVLRLRHLRVNTVLCVYDKDGAEERIEIADHGNLNTTVEPWRRPAPAGPDAWLDQLRAMDGVETIEAAPGVVSLRVRGLEFARLDDSGWHAGITRKRQARELAAVMKLASELAAARRCGAAPNTLQRRNPEAWLESVVRANIRLLDATLVDAPVYGQVPAMSGVERGIIDLLAIDERGRLCVIELKASEDPCLPLQALDYWIRVAHHAARGDFARAGYFPGREVSPAPPRLLLVAPALSFHPTTEAVLRAFAPQIEVERIGLGVKWQSEPQVMLRLSGAQRPGF